MRSFDPTIRRDPTLLLRGLTVNRARPDLAGLAAETDPERFVWRVLPHAARSFAASIVVLPGDQALQAAVGYLYCRMLDTYEDLHPAPELRVAELRRFGSRFDHHPPASATPIPADLARDDRDRVHLLLVARCELVDSVFETFPDDVRQGIAEMVAAMAEGMVWSTDAFMRQGGVLVDERQLATYCRHVIGHPAIFALGLIGGREFTEHAREDAYLVSEMIQLANVTRDIETDLARGIGYHPALKPYLGSSGYQPEPQGVVREVRQELLARALGRVAAYRRLFEGLDLGRTAGGRVAAVLMLLFTDLHYRGCAERTGNRAWRGPRGRLDVVARALPALASPRWASHTLKVVERDFLGAVSGLAATAR